MNPTENDDYEGPDSELESDDIPDIEPEEAEELAAAEADGDAPKRTEAEKALANDLAEAESLTVTAKKSERERLEEELAKFLSRGGTITEVPPDEHHANHG